MASSGKSSISPHSSILFSLYSERSLSLVTADLCGKVNLLSQIRNLVFNDCIDFFLDTFTFIGPCQFNAVIECFQY